MGLISDALSKSMGSDSEEEEVPMSGMEEEDGGDGKAELLATKSVLKAVKSGDAEALRSALKSFMSACGY